MHRRDFLLGLVAAAFAAGRTAYAADDTVTVYRNPG